MSDNTVRVEVVRAQFRYDREQYTQGDEIEVTEATLRRHPQSLARIDDGDEQTDEDGADEADGDGDAVEPVPEEELDPHPSDLTVDQLRDRVSGVEKIALLKGIRQAEDDGENRTTAIEAIDDRINAVEE